MELETTTKREEAKEEGALIARLPVVLRGSGGEEASAVRLSELRTSRRQRPRRPVLCIGGTDFCRRCIKSSAELAEELDRADFLLVPVLSTPDGERAALLEAACGLGHVALPCQEGAADWNELCRRQLEQVRSQGLSEAEGLVVIIRKNGRVATRFLGVPNWGAIASEVDARVSAGMDTTNV